MLYGHITRLYSIFTVLRAQTLGVSVRCLLWSYWRSRHERSGEHGAIATAVGHVRRDQRRPSC